MSSALGQPIVGADGRRYVPVRTAQSRPFSLAVLAEWRLADGVDRGWMYRLNAFNVPEEVMARILPKVRARLERQEQGGAA